ncbi:MAG: hypothetical protein IID55_06530 [Proteobacteria bacterium]|nr:hypothetical protein [Pseudomonadota bacterium]
MARNHFKNLREFASVLTATLPPLMLAAGLAYADGNSAGPDKIVVTRSDCAALVEHRPAARVEYRPGVDARGRPVVSADVAGTPRIALPDEIVIDVTVQVYQYLGRTPPPGLGDTAAKVGRLVLSDGKLTFNGEPLSDPASNAVAAACAGRSGG